MENEMIPTKAWIVVGKHRGQKVAMGWEGTKEEARKWATNLDVKVKEGRRAKSLDEWLDACLEGFEIDIDAVTA
jgi:hypothetical protein